MHPMPRPSFSMKWSDKMKRIKERLYIDGYNILNAWEALKKPMELSLENAREALIEMMNEYQSFSGIPVYLVFDAYQLKGGIERKEKRGTIQVIFTKELETADAYIERKIHEHIEEYRIYVATSDSLEQQTVLGKGAIRISAKELEIRYEQMKQMYKLRQRRQKRPFEEDVLSDHLARKLEKILTVIDKRDKR